jgi:hypothetical protein
LLLLIVVAPSLVTGWRSGGVERAHDEFVRFEGIGGVG